MEIITEQRDKYLFNHSKHLFRGFVTGPIRMIMAVAQIALNSISLIFSPCLARCSCAAMKEKVSHNWYCITSGVGYFFGGILEFLPFSSFYFATDNTKIESSSRRNSESDSLKHDSILKEIREAAKCGYFEYSFSCSDKVRDEILDALRGEFPNIRYNTFQGKFFWGMDDDWESVD